jgi:hypothetical protein
VGIEAEFERMGSFVRDFVRLENLEGIKSEVKNRAVRYALRWEMARAYCVT